MAMRTASPWWTSLVFGLGLLFIMVGERLFGHLDGVRMFFTGLGLAGVLGSTALRAWTMSASKGARRKVEATLLLFQAGGVGSLILYALTTRWGVEHLGLSATGAAKFITVVTVLWSIKLLCSLVPLFMIEMSLGIARRTGIDVSKGNDDEGVELLRVRDIGWSGLTLGLAASFLMVTCNVANQRNIQKDVSYFKTSSPGESSINIASASAEPLKIVLFFPDPNEVKDQVKAYFEQLAAASGKITIEEHDRYVDAELAAHYKIPQKDPDKNGVIVIVRGEGPDEKSQTLELETNFENARRATNTKNLRTLDREVNTILLKLVRERRKVYLTVGHGELNDRETLPADMKAKVLDHPSTLLKKRLGDLNYDVKDLGLMDMSKDIPDDAAAVLMLAPVLPLADIEWAALTRYIDRGGRVLIALDPRADPTGVGPLEGKLGVKFNPAPLTDDTSYRPTRGNLADRRLFVVTNQFSAHASMTGLSRTADKRGLLLIDAGTLEDVPFTATANQPKKTVILRSMESSWVDLTDSDDEHRYGIEAHFKFDPTKEKRQRYTLGVAVEGPKVAKTPEEIAADTEKAAKDAAKAVAAAKTDKEKEKAAKPKDVAKDKDGFRVLVFSDVDLFGDLIMSNAAGQHQMSIVSDPLLDDAVKWLVGDEALTGDVQIEDDIAMDHTKNQDAFWFALTIFGAPLAIVAFGLIGTWLRRRRNRKLEVKS